MCPYLVTLHFEVHKRSKQIFWLKYFCDASIRNGGLKRGGSTQWLLSAKAMVVELSKELRNFSFSRSRALKCGAIYRLFKLKTGKRLPVPPTSYPYLFYPYFQSLKII